MVLPQAQNINFVVSACVMEHTQIVKKTMDHKFKYRYMFNKNY